VASSGIALTDRWTELKCINNAQQLIRCGNVRAANVQFGIKASSTRNRISYLLSRYYRTESTPAYAVVVREADL